MNDPVRNDLAVWLPYVDAFADGSLAEKDAVRLRVAAGKSPDLAAAIERASSFHSALAAMPVAEPGVDFATRIMESIPLQRYASAPRRAPVVVALGEMAPDFLQRLVVRLGAGLSALAVAWLAVLAVGSTALRGQISVAATDLGLNLQLWAETSASTPVIAPLARGLSAAYDASHGALGSMAGTLGLGLTIFAAGAVVGSIALWLVARRRGIATRHQGRMTSHG
ncbi:hypothetical protein DRQ53_02650 [bacterium]|nr:MAG: hypothetical protein DRQ53_02650 [bacterium]